MDRERTNESLSPLVHGDAGSNDDPFFDVVTVSDMNLFRRREQIRPEVATALAQLDQLAESQPALRSAARLQGAIMRVIYRDLPASGALDLAPERVAEKLRVGTPLLRDEPVPLDLPAIEALMLQLCGSAREHGDAAEAARAIDAALRRRTLDAGRLAGQVLLGQASAIRERAAELGVDGALLCALLRFSLFPALATAAAQLAPLLTAARWEQSYCPICGSWPLLAEQRGLEQVRFLRCGLCAAEWATDRLRCPFCGSRDHEDLGYLHVEGDDQKRAVTCERCRGYIKVLASLAPIPPLDLVVHDLATIHLDLVAIERGYTAPI